MCRKWSWLCVGPGLLTLVVTVGCLQPDTPEEDLIVRTRNGLVQGITETTRTGKEVRAFLGIRYAEPPIGKLRFLPPVPVQDWQDVFNATANSESCFQKMLRVARFIPALRKQLPTTPMSEDCLKLNVWVPKPKPNKSAVIVWIHGGGFTLGSITIPAQSGGTLAAEENVIVVSMNYRLASLGFLYLNHSDVPGNAGLYDQKLALEWIHDNIEAFGGDPENVLLMGQSAGAASAALHSISGMSDHLYRRIAVMSAPVIPWAVMTNEVIYRKGVTLAKNTGCWNADLNMTATIDCLRTTDASELIDNEPSVGYNTMVFRPTVDGKIVPDMPEKFWDSGKLQFKDLLLGSNRDEGTMFLTLMAPVVFQVIKQDVNPSIDDYDDILKDFFHDEKIVKIVQYEYSRWIDMTKPRNVLRYLEKTVNDYFFTCNTNRMAKLYAESGKNVYKYYFVHPSPSSLTPDWFGAFHGAEIYYVFGDVFDFKPDLGEKEKQFGHRMMRYLGNFARTGDPNLNPDGTTERIQWPKHTPDSRQYLVLAPNSTSVGVRLREGHCSFWDHYFPFISNQIGFTMINE